MSSKYKRVISTTTLVVIVAVMQAFVGIGFAARTPDVNTLPTGTQEISGILTTDGNKPIIVNGASVGTGATILSGATIETPDQVSATINIPGHGSLQIPPNSKVTVQFDQNGNIRVTVTQGCLVLRTTKGTGGEVNNAQGAVGKTDSAKDDVLNACAEVKTAGAAAGDGGLSTGAKVAIAAVVGGGVTGLYFGLRGDNPSPGAP
jgi:hypothetical protein